MSVHLVFCPWMKFDKFVKLEIDYQSGWWSKTKQRFTLNLIKSWLTLIRLLGFIFTEKPIRKWIRGRARSERQINRVESHPNRQPSDLSMFYQDCQVSSGVIVSDVSLRRKKGGKLSLLVMFLYDDCQQHNRHFNYLQEHSPSRAEGAWEAIWRGNWDYRYRNDTYFYDSFLDSSVLLS